jgi:sugar lactone lactonase YvrE
MHDRRFNLAPARLIWCAVLTLTALITTVAPAAAYDWKLLRPSNSGIPGEEIRFLQFTPDGKLWVGARWPFWEEGGVGIYDRTSKVWTTWANWETPIPSEYVNDIAFGPGGVVWIATNRGLAKKDGDSWTVYTHANSPLLHDEIRQIALDSQGHVWINNTEPTTQNAAIFEFTGTSWRQWAVPVIPWTSPWRQLEGVVVDHNDHVWVGNRTLPGVAEWNGTTWTLHGESMDVMVPKAVDANNNIWVIEGHLGYVVHKWNGTTFVPWGGSSPPLPITTNTEVAVNAGTVYIGNWTGQIAKTTNGGTSWTLFTDLGARIVGMAFDPLSSDVWLGTPGNVHQVSSSAVWQRSLNTYNTGIPDYFIDRFNSDRDGNFWVATGEAGLSRFDGQRWRNWGAHNMDAEPYPFVGNEPMGCAFHAADGTIWMGGNGIAHWDPTTGLFTGFWNWENNPGMGTGLFTYITQDMNGVLFAVEQDGGAFRFNGVLWMRDNGVNADVPSGELPGMARDSHGNVWIADRFALHRWDGTSWTSVSDSWGLFDLDGVNAMAIGPDDSIWLGTESGLLRWTGTGAPTLFTTANTPLPTDPVKGVTVRSDGLLAISASKFQSVTPFPCGLCIVSGDPAVPANWTVYGWGTSPLPHYQLGAVAFDPRGDLWLSAASRGAAIVLTGSGVTAVEPVVSTMPGRLAFRVSGPNPLRVSNGTDIDFVLPGPGGVVRLEIFDTAGRRVRVLVDGPQLGQVGRVHWDGAGEQGERLPAGIYLARIAVGHASQSLKLALVH